MYVHKYQPLTGAKSFLYIPNTRTSLHNISNHHMCYQSSIYYSSQVGKTTCEDDMATVLLNAQDTQCAVRQLYRSLGQNNDTRIKISLSEHRCMVLTILQKLVFIPSPHQQCPLSFLCLFWITTLLKHTSRSLFTYSILVAH